MFFLGLC